MSALPAGKAIYLCCAVIVDAVFISGFLDLLRNPLNEFLYFLSDYTANINNSDDMMCFINFSNRQAHRITEIVTAKCILKGYNTDKVPTTKCFPKGYTQSSTPWTQRSLVQMFLGPFFSNDASAEAHTSHFPCPAMSPLH